MPTITEQTQHFIAKNPFIKDCLHAELINYSALARVIGKSLQLSDQNFDAIVVAARRYARELSKQESNLPKVQELFKQSRVEIKNKVYIVVLKPGYPYKTLATVQQRIKDAGELIHMVESPSGTTIITSMEFSQTLTKHFKPYMVKQHRDAVEIIIKSPQDIESISGTVSYIYSLLGENGVNIIETASCWTDTILLLHEQDVAKAMSLLQF